MRINYFSDIHLEFGAFDIPETNADIIIAAGDIGIYTQGIEWLLSSPVPVIYVAGNHEFYQHEYHDTVSQIKALADGSHVHFLNNNSVEINGVRFLGTTLWTSLGEQEGVQPQMLSETVNDFRQISYLDEPLTEFDYLHLHREARLWLTLELEKSYCGNTVIVTHHAPTGWSWNGPSQSLMRYAYCNDLREIMQRYDVSAWIHGHTHNVLDYGYSSTRILCNPRGYQGRQLVNGFDCQRTLILD